MKTPSLMTADTICDESLAMAQNAIRLAELQIRGVRAEVRDAEVSPDHAARKYNSAIKELFDHLSAI